MQHITGESVSKLQTRSLQALLAAQGHTEDPELAAEASFILTLTNPMEVPWRTDVRSLALIMAHLPDSIGIARSMQAHYNERIPIKSIEGICDLLHRRPHTKRAVIDLWESEDTERASGSACVNYFWFRRIDSSLICRVHMRACDVYTKLAGDIAIFSSVALELSKCLRIPLQCMDLLIDCGHIYKKDANSAESLMEALSNGNR